MSNGGTKKRGFFGLLLDFILVCVTGGLWLLWILIRCLRNNSQGTRCKMCCVNLDKKNDILYIALSDMRYSYGEETENGVVVFRNMKDESITGVTIFDFLKRFVEN